MNDASRWSRVSEILSQALDLPESERAAFLEDVILKEPLLRTEVMGLFDELRGVEAFLERPALPPLGSAESFGPYRIAGELGEGGMGVVYLAERSDGQFARKVAIKRIGRIAPDSDLLRRFRDEKQIALAIAAMAAEEDPRDGFARLEAATAEFGLGRALLSLGTPDVVVEGCAALRGVENLWNDLRSRGELPANEAAELDSLASWLARCPAGK